MEFKIIEQISKRYTVLSINFLPNIQKLSYMSFWISRWWTILYTCV